MKLPDERDNYYYYLVMELSSNDKEGNHIGNSAKEEWKSWLANKLNR